MMFASVINSARIVGLFSVAAFVTSTVVHEQQQQQQQRELNFDSSLFPSEVLAVIPIDCRGANDSDSELQGAIDCAVENLLSCSGLLSVMDQFGDLIPTSSANVNGCGDIEDSFCPIATKCMQCIDEFDVLARCIVDNTRPGVIDQAVINLVSSCPLTCNGNPDPVVVGAGNPDPVVVGAGNPDPVVVGALTDVPVLFKDLKDIATTAVDAGVFTTLVAALDAAGLVPAVSEPNGPVTVFAPTDDAFSLLPDGLVTCLLVPSNKEVLTELLFYHVASSEVFSYGLLDGMKIPTLGGENVTIGALNDDYRGVFTVNGSIVSKADVRATNGVIHFIDTVLVPPSIDIAAFLETCEPPPSMVTTGGGGEGINSNGSGAVTAPETENGNGEDPYGDLLDNLSENPESIGSTLGGFVGSIFGEQAGATVTNFINAVVGFFTGDSDVSDASGSDTFGEWYDGGNE